MTKKLIELKEDNNWLSNFTYVNRSDAIEYLKTLPEDCILQYELSERWGGYPSVDSYISHYREETDLEYNKRIAQDTKAATKKAVDKIKRVASLEKELPKLKKEIK